MIVGVIIVGGVGIVLVTLGCLLWKKEMVSLLHDYHYDKVPEEDKKAFCALSGLGLVTIGAGLLATAVILAVTESLWSFAGLALGFAVGVALLLRAGKKYNSGPK